MKVLIAPLNWGIGHATRSIPLIESHLNKGNQVIIASSGHALKILRQKFPTLETLALPDYQITYHKKLPVWLSICLQGVKILKAIKTEHLVISEYCNTNKVNQIISDNRYGVYHQNIYSQLVCHQLNPITPLPILQTIGERIHKYLCRNFNEILVPDYESLNKRLSGSLSQISLHWKPKISFIGPLSHLDIKPKLNNGLKRTDILVLLSGIEPQRTILEQKIISQLKDINKLTTIVGGKVDNNSSPTDTMRYFPFLHKEDLKREIMNARYIICRSGYSTIMDLHLLRNKILIFIPTPGQTEQEYLANVLSQKYSFMHTQTQNNLQLKVLIENIPDNN